jgi:hypothetical protein
MSFQDINTFKGNSVILNTDRIIFNTKKDNIFLLSKKDVVISAYGDVHINVGPENYTKKDKFFIVNSPIIQLGLSSKGELEPIAKGAQAEKILNKMITALDSFSIALKTATGAGAGVVNLIQINAAADKLSSDLKFIQKNIQKIKSETTYSI